MFFRFKCEGVAVDVPIFIIYRSSRGLHIRMSNMLSSTTCVMLTWLNNSKVSSLSGSETIMTIQL